MHTTTALLHCLSECTPSTTVQLLTDNVVIIFFGYEEKNACLRLQHSPASTEPFWDSIYLLDRNTQPWLTPELFYEDGLQNFVRVHIQTF
jgi:hypothetical protein